MGLSENPIPLQGDLTRDLETLAAYISDLDNRIDEMGGVSIYTEAEWNALDTSSYVGGEEVKVVDSNGLTRRFMWNNYTSEWV